MLKKFFVFLLIVIVVLLVGFYSISGELATYASNQLAREVAKKDVYLTFSRPSFGLVNFKTQNLEIDYPKKGLRLQLQRIKLTPSLLSLLTKQKSADFQFRIFNGGIVGSLSVIGEDTFEITDLLVKNWELKQIPYLSMASIEAGRLGYSADSVYLEHGKPTELSNFKINLKDFRSNGIYLPQQVTKSLPLSVPAFQIDDLTTRINSRGKGGGLVYDFDDLQIDSSLFKLSGKMSLAVGGRKPRFQSASFQVDLTDQGSQLVGGFLPLISSQQLKSDSKRFTAKFSRYINNLAVFAFSPNG